MSAMEYNKNVELLRDEEYPMMRGKVYLDHAGSTIYAKSLIDTFSRNLIENLYGNPHSASAPAELSGHVVDDVRKQTLHFFNADPEHFDLVFTANATASIKLVAESFHDLASASSVAGTFWYGYHKDSHTSLVGVRELTKGTHHCFINDEEVEDWLDGSQSPDPDSHNDAGLPGLFAYPGQSNMIGRRLPLHWPGQLRKSSILSHQNTYSLLDAAALATTTGLDFSDPDAAPDFTAVSFYKIFGFPDLGGLIVRKASGHILQWRKYFGGGTVNSLTVLHEQTVQRKDSSIHDNLEDGTLPFHNIMALGCAIDVHKNLFGSMKSISQHTSYLSHRLCTSMRNLSHFNGVPVCTIYTDDPEGYSNPKIQGAIIAFNIRRANGQVVGHSLIEKAANDNGIYLRSGGLCNPGGITSYLQLEPWHMKRNWSAGHRCGDADLDVLNGRNTGVVRASLGAMSTIEDVDTFLDFLAINFAETSEDVAIESLDLNLFQRNDSGYSSIACSIAPSHQSFAVVRHHTNTTDMTEKMAMSRKQRNTRTGQAPRMPDIQTSEKGDWPSTKVRSIPDFSFPGKEAGISTEVGIVTNKEVVVSEKTSQSSPQETRRFLKFWKSKKK